MKSILKEICDNKRNEVHKQELLISKNNLIDIISKKSQTKGFKKKIDSIFSRNDISIIAEIKKGSPSKGVICKNFDPVRIAKNYIEGNASCLSILTDNKYFYGKKEDLIKVRRKTKVPILRKDFIISKYQIYESRAMGADCILLISSVLKRDDIVEFTNVAHELDLDVLIEIHTKEELIDALKIDNTLIGINNRNLKNMEVNIKNSIEMVNYMPNSFNFICESGISSKEDIISLMKYGFKSFLIGEYLMREEHPQTILNQIFKTKLNG